MSGLARSLLVLSLLLPLAGCATSPPSKPKNACAIFQEKDDWYADAEKARKRWGTPVHVTMAIMYHESGYRHDAKPPRARFLGIPMPWRKSDAYGYAQVKDDTWDWYKDEAGGWGADRDDFDDAVDFIAWYAHISQQRLGISKWDARNQYLAYHEGHGGYKRGTHRNKGWLLKRADIVAGTASRYRSQLAACEDDLDDGGFWFF